MKLTILATILTIFTSIASAEIPNGILYSFQGSYLKLTFEEGNLVGDRLVEALKETNTVEEVVNEYVKPGESFRAKDTFLSLHHKSYGTSVNIGLSVTDLHSFSSNRYIAFKGEGARVLFNALGLHKKSYVIAHKFFGSHGKPYHQNYSVTADPNGRSFSGSNLSCGESRLLKGDILCELIIKK